MSNEAKSSTGLTAEQQYKIKLMEGVCDQMDDEKATCFSFAVDDIRMLINLVRQMSAVPVSQPSAASGSTDGTVGE